MFKVYSTTTCAYCQMVKKVLASKEQPYQEINLDEQPEQRDRVIELSGRTAVPVVTKMIDDEETLVCIGWNPKLLMAAM